jgi:glutathione S-transferase
MPVAQPVLHGESFSPFTHKARWALEHCGVAYSYSEYIPTLSEPAMRVRLRQWGGAVSVPILFAGERVLRGSWDIARYAAEVTGDGRLGDFARIEPWNELSDRALCEGRTRVVRSVRQSTAALDEAVANVFPAWLVRPMRFVARDASARLDRKYAHLVQEGAMRQALLRVRDELARSGSDFLLGAFSYADIAMVSVLQMVDPVARCEPPLGPATLACWSEPTLAQEFADLLAWRARLISKSHPKFSQLQHLA